MNTRPVMRLKLYRPKRHNVSYKGSKPQPYRETRREVQIVYICTLPEGTGSSRLSFGFRKGGGRRLV